METYNNIVILGNVGEEPEIRKKNGKKMASFSVATTYGYGINCVTDWHNVVAWDKKAEVVERFVGKGSPIMVSGPMRYYTYEKNDGVKVTRAEILANEIKLLGRKEEEDLPA